MVQAAKVAHWVKADGTVTEVVPSKGTKFTLEEVQEFVGGYVERLKLPHRTVMLMNEEGIPRNLPLNEKASSVAGRDILGDVVIMPHGMGW